MLEGLPPNGASTLLRFISDASRARAVADFIVETFDPAETAACVFEDEKTGLWTAEVFFQEPPDEGELRALIESVFDAETAGAVAFAAIEERDWVENALAGLKPVRAGRILVHGAHDRARLSANDVGVEIEAALAFGTGHHGTTLGCLLALEEVLKRRRPRRALDVGTGTGVLAIAGAKLLHQAVACGDIDAVSVATARANALANGVGPYVRPLLATGVRHEALRGRRFDLIFANILAKPLRLLAPSLTRVAAPNAELILSGLLARDVPGVLTAYRAQGFRLLRRRDIDGWATLLLCR
ncbi:50S ribosomal protein L11 methyltransferase [Methylocystis bryophila]|uniref:Ribosomal protein L11 methyltransferase n=1 Tax=Methylocystis bryophila TaxID=655015 RepID=A0A1W6MRG9_9HYPH|nr:50S ribosomal protein L11 methyltransferase [Methylocystis bryophila]ARN80165.1 SAM-dependent methyltransferase [Methylocystis bryophila]BDV40107.1 ribosomal protein L11 methyltransferase [Methylocystis bryophila]